MYSSFHASAAIGVLLLPLPIPVTIPLAIVSHAVVDMLGEGNINKWVPKEAVLNVFLLVAGFLSGHFLLAGLGIFLGNLFDFIDKVLLKKDFIHKQGVLGKIWYPPVLIQLTTSQTLFLNGLSVVITSLLMLMVK